MQFLYIYCLTILILALPTTKLRGGRTASLQQFYLIFTGMNGQLAQIQDQ